MQSANLPTEEVAVLAAIDPANHGTGAVQSAWVAMSQFHRFRAQIATGVLGAGATIDLKIEQAQDNGGQGAKDVTGKAITQIVKATGDNRQAAINCTTDELDSEQGFAWVRVEMTVGGAASFASVLLEGFSPRHGPAQNHQASSVLEAVQ